MERPDAKEVCRVLDACAALLAPLPALERAEVLGALVRMTVATYERYTVELRSAEGRVLARAPLAAAREFDDGPESVPEGAQGRGPGWAVTVLDPLSSPAQIDAAIAESVKGGGGLVQRDPLTGERPWCDGPPEEWGTGSCCSKRALLAHAGFAFCAECALSFERLRRLTGAAPKRPEGTR